MQVPNNNNVHAPVAGGFEKVINYENYDFKASSIIKPSLHNFDGQHTNPANNKHAIVVSSVDRNKVIYPDPNKYIVDLPGDYQDVLAVEMIVSNIHFNPYNVTSMANRIYVVANGVEYEAVVTPGKYTSTTMIGAIESALNSVLPSAGFSVTYDAITLKFTFQANVDFQFRNADFQDTPIRTAMYVKKSMLKKLGFGCDVYSSDTSHKLLSPFAAEILDDPNEAIVMNVESMSVQISVSDVVNKCFSLIHKTSNFESTSRSIRKTFNPPLARINKMRLAFTDTDGVLYDFQNRDHIIEFIFETPKTTSRYKAYIAD